MALKRPLAYVIGLWTACFLFSDMVYCHRGRGATSCTVQDENLPFLTEKIEPISCEDNDSVEETASRFDEVLEGFAGMDLFTMQKYHELLGSV